MDGNLIGGPVDPGKQTPFKPEHPLNSTEQDDFADASKSTVDLDQFMPLLKPKRTALRVVSWMLVLLLLIAAGGGVYWYEKHKVAAKSIANTQHKTAQTKSKPVIVATTKQYSSTNFNLSFNYPQDWVVSDTGNGALTVTSPDMQLTAADGQFQTGQVVMTIQNENAANFSMFKQGSAVAVLPSQHINYTNPPPTQQASAYISFLQYATTTTRGGLDGVFVTGNFGYQKDGTIPESNITQVDPVITVTFNQCSNSGCTSTKPLTIASSMWSDTNFSNPIVKMIESLQIQ